MSSPNVCDGDVYIHNLASFIKSHERQLANALLAYKGSESTNNSDNNKSLSTNNKQDDNDYQHSKKSKANRRTVDPTTIEPTTKPVRLSLSLHHLYFLLGKFQDLGISVGQMRIRLDNIDDPDSTNNYVSFLSEFHRNKNIPSDAQSIHSMSSVKSVMSSVSALWNTLNVASSKGENIMADLKYLHSAFTKLPCLRLAPDKKARLIEGHEEYPFETSTPLKIFKSLAVLEISELDPKEVYGWDLLSERVRFLVIKRAKIIDPADVLVDLVYFDSERRGSSLTEEDQDNRTGSVPSSASSKRGSFSSPTFSSAQNFDGQKLHYSNSYSSSSLHLPYYQLSGSLPDNISPPQNYASLSSSYRSNNINYNNNLINSNSNNTISMSVPNSSNNNSNNNNNSASIANNNNSNSNTNTTPTLNFASLSTSTITSPSSNTPFAVPQSSSSNTGNFNYGGDTEENHSNTNSARKSLSSVNVPLNLQHSRSRTYQSQHSSIFYNYQSSASPSNRRNKRSNSLTNSQGEILNQNSLVYQNLSVSGVNQNSYGNNVSSLQMHQQQQEDQQQQQQQEDQQHAQLYQSSYTNSHSHLHPHSYSHSHSQSQSQSHPHSHSYSHSYSHSHSLYHTNNHSHSSIANSNGSGYHSNQISSSININNNISGNVSNDNANQGAIINSNGNSEEESSLEEITRWKNLKYLSLTENDIINISQWSFDSMQNLSSLDLSYNKITKIPTKPLSKLINLKSLNLSYNRFTSMKGMPRTLKKLSVLNIKGNQIDCLDDLEYLISLKKIDLRQNKISKMSQLIPLFLMKDEENTLSLTGLYIAGNAITGNRGYRIELFNLFNGVDYLNNLRIDGSRPGIFESRLLLDFRNARLKLKQFLDETIIIQMAESVSSMNLNKMLQNPKETTINDSDKAKGFNGSSSDKNTFVSNKILPNNQRIKSSSNPKALIPESKTSIAGVGAHSRSVSITSATTSTTTMTSTTTTTTTRTTSAPNQDISSLIPGNSSSKTYSTPILSYNTTTVVSSTIEPRRLTGISETETETETESEIQKSNANPHTNSTTSLNSVGKERNNDDTSLMPPPKLYSLGSYNNSNNNSTSNDNNTNSNTNKVSSTSNSPLIDRNISFPATSPFATGSGSYFTSKMTPVSTSDIVSGLGINGGNSSSTPTIPQSPASTLVSASNYVSASGVGANIGNREVGSTNLDDHELFNVHSSGSNGNNNNNPLNPNKNISRRPSGHSSILSSFIEQTSQLSSLQNHPKGGNSGDGISTPSSASHADLLNNDRSNILKGAPNLPGEIIHSPSVSAYHSPVNLFSSPVSSMSNSTANNTSNPISRISIAAPALPIVTAATTTITSGYPAPKLQDKNEDLEIPEPKSNKELEMPTSIKAIQMSKYPSTVSASSEITPNSISDYSDNEYVKQDILPKTKFSSINNKNHVGDNEEKENILVDLNSKTSESDLTGSGIEPALYYILKDNTQNFDKFDKNDNDINNENSKNDSRIRVDTATSTKNNILSDTNTVFISPVSQISMNKVGTDLMFKDKNFNYETASTRD